MTTRAHPLLRAAYLVLLLGATACFVYPLVWLVGIVHRNIRYSN